MKRQHHRTKILKFTISSIFLILFLCINSCQKENYSSNEQSLTEKFFAYNGQRNLTEAVIRYLRIKNDSAPFAEKFAEKYGMPIWKGSVDIYESEQSALFVPVHKEEQAEIEHIWVFKNTNNKLAYNVIDRGNSVTDDEWMFDYFTQEVLNKKPKSGLIIRPMANDPDLPSTRATTVFRICNEIYTGNNKDGLTYKYRHCWNIDIDIPDSYDPHENPGAGECKECMEVGPGVDEGGAYSPDTPEVIPDKSLNNYPEIKKIYDCVIGNAEGFTKQWLSRFIGTVAPFNLTFKIGTGDNRKVTGYCDFTTNIYHGEIVLNKDRIGRSSLEIIRTLMHESMHAYMHAYVYSKYSADSLYGKSTFDEAFDKFQKQIEREQPYLGVEAEHKYMAENWIKTMAEELHRLHQTQTENYDKFWKNMEGRDGIDINNKLLFYEALSWQGLENTEAYKNINSTELKPYLDNATLLPVYNSEKGIWTCK